ncbi:alpha-hydroxy acid oxidase [Ideonella sp. DXS22W]|uniref:Alpha-hydroxy acid oxidase n=1 Tax=Pseudaquabacterium inlustre TaxID=2984192 RepID=A0ABU9CEQ4_9BURK
MTDRPPHAPVQAPLQQLPAGLGAAADYARLAQRFIAEPLLAHLDGGAGHDRSAAANLAAFGRWQVMPRLLRDLRHGHTRCRPAGLDLPHPLLLAAVARLGEYHPQAERAVAQAAAATDTVQVLSTLSSLTLEEVAAAAPAAPRWFQLYLQPRREATQDLLRRAAAAGYRAVVLTLDAPVQSPSLRALRAGYRAPAAPAPNLLPYAAGDAALPTPPLGPGDSRVFQGALRHAPRSEDLDWLLADSPLPVWIKGVLHPDDARALATRGVAGLVVSNHGGRSLDGAPASLDCLAAVRAAVGPQLPLLFDGGIRGGDDVFKALALGASAVMVGRLQAHALAVAGALGVAHMLKLLREELELTMALAGCATLADIGPHCLVAAPAPIAPPPSALAPGPDERPPC